MTNIRAAKRYAKALFEIGEDEKIIDPLVKDMQLIYQTLQASRELKFVLKSPVINDNKKIDVLENVFADTHQMTRKSFHLLAENKRIPILIEMAEQFIARYRETNNIKKAEVITSAPLTDDLREKITSKVENLTGATAELAYQVDENLMGGFILQVDDLRYDASVSGRLNALRNQLKSNVAL